MGIDRQAHFITKIKDRFQNITRNSLTVIFLNIIF
jgi:hypothetical protein